MHFDIISIFPEMFKALDSGIPARARNSGLIDLNVLNPRDFTTDKHRTVDDKSYGGGPGMVMLAEPLSKAIEASRSANPRSKIIYLSPQGKPLEQVDINRFAKLPALTLLCGRYEGIDQRIIDEHVDEEVSLGDYVISGGELAAMVLIDAIIRQIPGALGDADSASQDSFFNGLLDYPHYSKPENFDGSTVPKVLLSGNHSEIEKWRHQQALQQTWLKRPDLLKKQQLSTIDRSLLDRFISKLDRGENNE